MHYEIYLPFPPSVNSYYTKTQRGVYISKKGQVFRDQVNLAVIEQLPDLFITDRMLVEVVLFPPDRIKRDLDNFKKALLDSLTQDKKSDRIGIWEDDSLIDQLFSYRGSIKTPGMAYLRITDAGPVIRDVSMLSMD